MAQASTNDPGKVRPAVLSGLLRQRWSLLGWLAFLVVLTVVPLFMGESYVYLTTNFVIMALYAVSFNLLLGQTGMLSFGHAAYFGLGAYTVALLWSRLSIAVFPAILLAPLVAGVAALAIGLFCVRLTGMYFAMLTLAFAQLIFTVVFEWYSFTGGDNGLPVMPPDYLLAARRYYYFSLVIVIVCTALLRLIVSSPFGSALAAIRENPERAAFVGINVRLYQLAAFVFAGVFSGVAGGLMAPLQQMAFPSMLFWTQSADPVLMALTGGIHSFTGPIVGAAVFVFLNFAVTTVFDYPLFAFGALVLIVVLFFPGGIVGATERLLGQRRRGPAGYPAEAGEPDPEAATMEPDRSVAQVGSNAGNQ